MWRTSADFLRDASLTFIGLQESLNPAELGLMMYTHACGTTLAIEAEQPSALEPGLQPVQPEAEHAALHLVAHRTEAPRIPARRSLAGRMNFEEFFRRQARNRLGGEVADASPRLAIHCGGN